MPLEFLDECNQGGCHDGESDHDSQRNEPIASGISLLLGGLLSALFLQHRQGALIDFSGVPQLLGGGLRPGHLVAKLRFGLGLLAPPLPILPSLVQCFQAQPCDFGFTARSLAGVGEVA
jgi:hypothetical protein